VMNAPAQGPGMNSRNHHMFASIGAWLHRDVAGISINHKWVNPIRIAPMSDPRLANMSDSVETRYGTVRVDTNRAEDQMHMAVRIPLNVRAQVFIPAPLPGMKCTHVQDGEATLYRVDQDLVIMSELPAGVHHIEYDAKARLSTWREVRRST